MLSWLRLVMLWAVMLAVPLQGYAAATMAFCAPVGPPAAAAQAAHPADHDHGHHGAASAADHSSQADAGDHHAPADGHAAHGAAHKCGNCGACHALALTATLPQFVPQVLPPADLAEPFQPVATVAPRLLDKPPRA